MNTDNRTMKEILNIDTSGIKISCPLDKWFIELCGKTYAELTYDDTYRMLVQDIAVDIAVDKSLELLIDEPLCGIYDGQLLEKIVSGEFDLTGKEDQLRALYDALVRERCDDENVLNEIIKYIAE